jgi:hypothetical protein
MAIKLIKEGWHLLANDIVSSSIYSSYIKKDTLLYIMAARDVSGSRKNLARPGVGLTLAGRELMPQDSEKIMKGLTYQPIWQKTDDVDGSKDMTARDSRPALDAGVTQTDQFGTGKFVGSRTVTPIRVFHSDLEMAENAGGAAAIDSEISRLVTVATNVAMRKHETRISDGFFDGGYGSKAFNQDLNPWTTTLGLRAIFNNSGVFAGIDRTQSGADFLHANVISDQFAPDIFEIIDEATLGATKGTSDYDIKPGLVLCSKANFRKFKKQVQGKSFVTSTRGLVEMAEYGMTKEILNVDGTLVTWDRHYTSTYANVVDVLVLESFAVGFAPGMKFSVTPFVDNTKVEEAGAEYDWAHIQTKRSLICHEPWLQTSFANVS